MGRRGVPVAAPDRPSVDPGRARGSAALTSVCTAARRASRTAGSRPSPLLPVVLPVVVVVVVARGVVVATGSAIPLVRDENRCDRAFTGYFSGCCTSWPGELKPNAHADWSVLAL